jgi:hypothetical protein
MKTGTKSLLFGVHQFIWHPITVYIAWIYIYKQIPSCREAICIFIHDWGYWGKPKMDDADGERHPELAATLAGKFLGIRFHDLCLYHSRHYARNKNTEPSMLCWADKLSIIFDPWWLYLPRAVASGELKEYRFIADATGFISITATHREWHAWVSRHLSSIGKTKRATVVPYTH